MRHILIFFACLGPSLLLWLVLESGLGTVLTAAATVGWGLVPITVYHVIPMILDARAWHLTLPPEFKFSRLMVLRWVRESVNAMLPVAEIGGEVVGARLLILDKVPGHTAGAGVVFDRSLQVVAQAFYTLCAVVLLMGVAGGAEYLPWAGAVLVVGIALVLAFLLAQRWGLLRLLEFGGRKLATSRQLMTREQPANAPETRTYVLDGLHDRLMELYRDPRLVWGNFTWHMLAWLVNAGEVWLTLFLMGTPVTFSEAVIIHGLAQAARSAAFFIPAGLGVQEISYVVLGGLFGVSEGAALAASLIRRAREAALGLPGLTVWQVIEGRWFIKRVS